MPLTIENKTPWDSEALASFLTPLCDGTGIETIEVGLLRALPGRKREDQKLYDIGNINFQALLKNRKSPTKIDVGLISPKRTAARTDLLDRMAQVDDLAGHEIALPGSILGGIAHAFEQLAYACKGGRIGDQWEFRHHFTSDKYHGCECPKTLGSVPLIRGNTKTRTAPLVDITRLKRQLGWALDSADKWRLKMDERLKTAEKLRKRIAKEESKA